MSVVLVTGATGLIGSAAVRKFAAEGLDIVGVDNDMRCYFFGPEASTAWCEAHLKRTVRRYTHVSADIRDEAAMGKLFSRHGKSIAAVVHCAAQPSHDWAAREPLTDFSINAGATMLLLEMTRKHAPHAVFLFMSTNKVYGDAPNSLPFVEHETRWEVDPAHPFAMHGIDETMSLDRTMHSLFGASKAAADLIVQEFGRYFGMKTVCFRGGCLTGPAHSGAMLHGFLSYLVKCAVSGAPYTVMGYKGKQVRDNIHSADLANALWCVFQKPRVAEVYNIGGSRQANCSVLEAIAASERIVGRSMNWSYSAEARMGDHIWWISDVRRFQSHYPEWTYTRELDDMIAEIADAMAERTSG